jgi:hypothetical protein
LLELIGSSSWRYLPTTRDIYEPIAHQLGVSAEIVKRVGILRAVGNFPIYSSPSHGRRQNRATSSMVAFVRSAPNCVVRLILLAPDIVEEILDGPAAGSPDTVRADAAICGGVGEESWEF